jgi:hypothetical protein
MKEVIVVPSGTYPTHGDHQRGRSPGAPPWRAGRSRVAVGKLSTTTGDDGRYRLYGVAGSAQFRVTKNGYELMTRELSVQDHGIQNFELRITNPRIDVAGTYMLTLTVADRSRERSSHKLPVDAFLVRCLDPSRSGPGTRAAAGSPRRQPAARPRINSR